MKTSEHPADYCFTCKKVVARCWDSDGMCCGGGHCMECGAYDFADAAPAGQTVDVITTPPPDQEE